MIERNVGFLLGAAAGALVAHYRTKKQDPEASTPWWQLALGATTGGALAYHMMTPAARANGRHGMSKLSPEAVEVLSHINPDELYREEVEPGLLQIKEVYENKNTVGLF